MDPWPQTIKLEQLHHQASKESRTPRPTRVISALSQRTPTKPSTGTTPRVKIALPPCQLATFQPHPGNPRNPLDICADGFLKTQRFEIICAQAMQLATVLPQTPPPTQFISYKETPMHQWYEAFLVEFTNSFARRLRSRQSYPLKAVFGAHGSMTSEEDPAAFNTEAIAHINCILRGFNANANAGTLGCIGNLSIDLTKCQAAVAAMALKDVTRPAEFPPKADWKVGETLHTEYRRRLGMFRVGVVRLIQESKDDVWILDVPAQLERGVGAYEEYYIAHLRQNILTVKGLPEPRAKVSFARLP